MVAKKTNDKNDSWRRTVAPRRIKMMHDNQPSTDRQTAANSRRRTAATQAYLRRQPTRDGSKQDTRVKRHGVIVAARCLSVGRWGGGARNVVFKTFEPLA